MRKLCGLTPGHAPPANTQYGAITRLHSADLVARRLPTAWQVEAVALVAVDIVAVVCAAGGLNL